MTHDPLCVLSEPCDEETPEHGYCGFSAPRFCIHCHQWCICERLEKARADEREQAAEMLHGHSQHGYRCECGAELNNYEHHLQNVIRGEA